MSKIKLIIDFFRLWILWGDRKEAWQDAKINNDPTFQEEMQEFDTDCFEEPFISKEFIDKHTTKKYIIMNEQEIIKTQQELINLLYSQVVDLSMMSKIELGDDVIEEINRLKGLLNG